MPQRYPEFVALNFKISKRLAKLCLTRQDVKSPWFKFVTYYHSQHSADFHFSDVFCKIALISTENMSLNQKGIFTPKSLITTQNNEK